MYQKNESVRKVLEKKSVTYNDRNHFSQIYLMCTLIFFSMVHSPSAYMQSLGFMTFSEVRH